MGIESVLSKLSAPHPSVTPLPTSGVTAKPAPHKAGTPVTPQNGNVQGRWEDEPPADRGRRRLSILAKESGHPIADLLDWYQHDLDDLGSDTEVNVRAIVGDYVTRHQEYRRSIKGGGYLPVTIG
ncbi:hypothetical protein CCP3SC5AM1_3270002 [Gammaproteobacteria bacterium]